MTSSPPLDLDMISVEDAADILRMGRSTLYRLIKLQQVPHRVMPGTGTKFFTRADIAQIIADAHRPAVA